MKIGKIEIGGKKKQDTYKMSFILQVANEIEANKSVLFASTDVVVTNQVIEIIRRTIYNFIIITAISYQHTSAV